MEIFGLIDVNLVFSDMSVVFGQIIVGPPGSGNYNFLKSFKTNLFSR